MRILVTGAGNPFGRAIVRSLLKQGDAVRVFGLDPGVMEAFSGIGPGEAHWHAGDPAHSGSVEPALSERQALIHAAMMDEPASKATHIAHVERSARYSRYGAEREQVDHFIALVPAQPARVFAKAYEAAVEQVEATRGVVNRAVVRAGDDPDATAAEVLAILARLPELGKQPGRENDAVTA